MKDKSINKDELVSVSCDKELPVGVHLVMAVIFLIGAIIYTISPIDFIPDILGPIGWVDDIMVWVIVIMVDLTIVMKRAFKKGKVYARRSKQKDSFI
jgi:uncharacterized membrane protein YkvA (DUF1232 family)